MIILTAEQADAVRGPTSPGAALDPIALVDGTFVLPIEVLADPAHQSKWADLNALPTREVDPTEFTSFGSDA